jgi:transcriptional regulator with XRE-family HTH domain
MSGKENIAVTLKSSLNIEEYKNSHTPIDCDGKWEIKKLENIPYPLEAIGIISLPLAIVLQCPKCGATYFVPGFEEFVRRVIATQIVISSRPLGFSEIRFLRIMFGLTQKEVIEAIDLESVSYYSKCENGKEELSLDKQVRLKLHYACLLGIKNRNDYLTINKTTRRSTKEPIFRTELLRKCVLNEFLNNKNANSKFH